VGRKKRVIEARTSRLDGDLVEIASLLGAKKGLMVGAYLS
jgi:hypothetical protein